MIHKQVYVLLYLVLLHRTRLITNLQMPNRQKFYIYESTKEKLYKINAVIWQQKMCKIFQMTTSTTSLYIIVPNYNVVFNVYVVTITKKSGGSHKA